MSNAANLPFGTTLPFETTWQVRDTCLCLHAQRAARALARRFDTALKPAGLTHGQFSLLNALNRPAPTPMGPVAALLGMDRTTLTAVLKPLARRGLLEMLTDPEDRRGRRLRLTAEGHARLLQAVPIWQETHRAVEAVLPAPGASELRAGLQALAMTTGPRMDPAAATGLRG
jgi:DNA-binding MarR family transcriptional regulator